MHPLPSELYAVVEVFECDTLDDVARLYSTYDSKLQSRNVGDINRSFASCVPQLAEVDATTINNCVSAATGTRICKTDTPTTRRRKSAPRCYWNTTTLSSWSAGYSAIRNRILSAASPCWLACT